MEGASDFKVVVLPEPLQGSGSSPGGRGAISAISAIASSTAMRASSSWAYSPTNRCRIGGPTSGGGIRTRIAANMPFPSGSTSMFASQSSKGCSGLRQASRQRFSQVVLTDSSATVVLETRS